MDNLENLSNSVEADVNNFFNKASKVDESPVIEGFDDFFEVTDLNPPGSGVVAGAVTTEQDQDFDPTAAFSITVNGSTATGGTQTSPFTLDCIGGTGTYPARSDAADPTAPQTVTYASPTGESVSPPSSGTTTFIVYAKVSATMTANGGIDVATTGTIIIKETSAAPDQLGSNTRYKNNGSNSYTFFFLIGTVAASRRSDGRYSVRISQIQEGNYTYGNTISSSATAGGATVRTQDGLRKFTICINGEAFTADIDVSNIVKVT